MARGATLLNLLVLLAGQTAGLLPTSDRPARAGEADSRSSWGAGVELFGYAVPDAPDFVMAVAQVDVRWFHLEGRYDYEALHTASLFAGLNARAGERLRLEATAMVGGAFGNTVGIAPALRVTLSWWRLDLSTEGEYLFDLGGESGDGDGSFFYSWSELGFSPLSWLRVGLVGQRTRTIGSDLEIQRGVLVGLAPLPAVAFTLYELDLGWDSPTFIAAIAVNY